MNIIIVNIITLYYAQESGISRKQIWEICDQLILLWTMGALMPVMVPFWNRSVLYISNRKTLSDQRKLLENYSNLLVQHKIIYTPPGLGFKTTTTT